MAPETVSEEVAEVNQAKKEEGGKSICLDLINRVPDELWTEVHDTVQETGIKTILMEKKCKRAKWPSLQQALNEYLLNNQRCNKER